MGVPLLAAEKVIGLYAIGKAAPDSFTQRHVQLTEAPAAHATIAVQKARLFEQLEITEHKRAEEQVRSLAYHDALTGLPNRLLFQDRLALAVAQAHRHHKPLAVLFLDLDRFKVINDSLGHAETLVKNADTAMYRAKEQGRDNCRLYTPAMSATAPERLALEITESSAMQNAQTAIQTLRCVS